MSKAHTPSAIGRHELHRAYQILFDQDPGRGGLIFEREGLARTFRHRAYQFRPDRASELGRTRKELAEALKTVAIAFDLLADVIGEKDRVWVMPAVDDLAPSAIRSWQPRTEIAESASRVRGQPANAVEGARFDEATRRIKEALIRLKEQTTDLARSREGAAKPPPRRKSEEARAQRSLILGRHLHRQGLVSLRQLIAAVAWQRAQRPAVGQIAKSWGILSDDQVFDVLKNKEHGELFCDHAVRRGFMTPFQRLAIVGRQRVLQKPLGNYFVEQGILTRQQIESEVRALQSLQGETSASGKGTDQR